MCSLLGKEVLFEFDALCLRAFELLKQSLIEGLILIAPNWEVSFELICDDNDVAVGACVGLKKE